MEWILAIAVVVVVLVIVGRQQSRDVEKARPLPQPGPEQGGAETTCYLVMRGPDKGLLVRLDPFARWGSPGQLEGSWVCVDTERRMYVMVQGLDSQLGMVLLDLWAMLGPEAAEATLKRPMLVLPEPLLGQVEGELGGFRAMEGWMQVPSLANYEPPDAEDFPELLPLTLEFPSTSAQMFMQRGRLLEVAGRRTHPTPAKRASPTPTQRLKADSPERVTEVLQMALARYEQNPVLAVDILNEAFSEGLPPDPDLASAVCSTWGLCLRNAGRIDEALDRFDQGLELAQGSAARQDLHYNRGYARLMTLMSEQQSLGGEQLRSAFRVQTSDKLTLALCHADFTEALRLDPEDPHALGQLRICEQLIAAITPQDG